MYSKEVKIIYTQSEGKVTRTFLLDQYGLNRLIKFAIKEQTNTENREEDGL